MKTTLHTDWTVGDIAAGFMSGSSLFAVDVDGRPAGHLGDALHFRLGRRR